MPLNFTRVTKLARRVGGRASARRSMKCSSTRVPLLLLLFAQPAAALHIPSSLRRHLQHKLASALTSGAAPCAAADQSLQDDTVASSLVDALVEHTPEQADAAAWAHTSGTKLARLISANSTAGEELASGRLMVVDALALADARHRRSTDMFEAVQVHHAALRQAVRTSTPGAASASSAWESATADGEALQRYGEAAVDVGRRRWARLGIEWCTTTAHEHFHGGGAARRARKRAARAHYRATGEALPAEAAQRIERELAAASQVRQSQPIRLLDVGSCGFLFGETDGFLCTALDLCPQDPRTFECDFLRLQVGPRGEERRSYASGASGTLAAGASSAGRLESLPAASFDAVVFSLVFSYLPLAEQRAAMVAQARKLLDRPASPFAGLLLLVDTHSSMGSRSGRGKNAAQDEWVRTIESLGFELLTRQTLERSHALAFVAAPLRCKGDGDGDDDNEEDDEQDDDFELAAELATRLAAGARLRTRGEVEREEAQAAAGAPLNNGPGPSFGDELLMNAQGQGEGERQQKASHTAAERLTRWSAAAAFAGEHTAGVAPGEAVPLARYCASGAIFSALTSRTQANNAARRGELRLNGQEANGASRVRSGDVLSLQTPPLPPVSPPELRRLERFVDTLTLAAVRPEPGGGPEPGSGRLQVLHEDAEVAVVFKPPGVHSAPWAGTRKRWGTLTLSDALPLLLSPPPAGQVAAAPLAAPLPAHRLDARVGGVLVCAKSRRALAGLSALFKERQVHKVYRAIVVGEVDLSLLAARDSTPNPRLGARSLGSASEAEGDGDLSVSVGELACTAIEHAGDAGEVSPAGEIVSVLRVKEVFEDGRESITEVRVLQITPCSVHGALTTLDLRPLTGRRHQLRVACALGLGAPILGDDLYHPRANTARAASNLSPLPPVRRRAGLFLQALEVTLPHPVTGDTLSVRACEMARFGKLRAKAASGAGFTDEEWEAWRA